MADYLATNNLAHDENFRKRVQTAALVISRDILNEPSASPRSPRYRLAGNASRLDQWALDQLAWECALNQKIADAESTEAGSSEDSDLGYVVSSSWNRVAEAIYFL